METGVDLVSKGALKSCWYGNYHYLEPWVGCEHNCHYCYARVREAVTSSLDSLGGHHFNKPQLMTPTPTLLLEKIVKEITLTQAKTLKLCRYTDFFTPSMVKQNLSFQILKTICEKTDVARLIITTKGIPDEESIQLMKKYPQKFSFNMVILPESERIMMPFDYSNQKKMMVAKQIQDLKVQTTIHFDPIGLSILESRSHWEDFLLSLKHHQLMRVMFSYMVLDQKIDLHMKKNLPEDLYLQFRSLFSFEKEYSYNYVDIPLSYIKTSIRQQHLDLLASLLKQHAFHFVLCSLKSAKGGLKFDKDECPPCTGEFYA